MDKKSKGIIAVLSIFLLAFFVIILGLLYHISNMNAQKTDCVDPKEIIDPKEILESTVESESAFEGIVITRIDHSTGDVKQTYNVTKAEDIDLLNNAKNNIHVLEDSEQVKLAIPIDVIIKYDENTAIGIGLEEKYYCMYQSGNEEKMAKMPDGLFEYINSIIVV